MDVSRGGPSSNPPDNVAVLFGCSSGEISREVQECGHSIFFHVVINGLKGKAANQNGEVTLEQFAAYVRKEVPIAAEKVKFPQQHPQYASNLSRSATLVTGLPANPSEPGSDDDTPAGRKVALLVGVRKYQKDGFRKLEYAENDVNDLAQILRDAHYRRVVVLTQADAAAKADSDLLPTAQNIRDQMQALLTDRRENDTVLLAFSGHGVQPKGQKEHYFCPMDATPTDVTTMVSLLEVYKQLGASKAGVKVLLADCCRTEPQRDLDKGAAKMDLESVTRPQAERPPTGVAALFSCSEGQAFYDSDVLKHGVFFHFVIEGLKGKAANKRGEVTLEHLAAYVEDEVPDQVKEDVGKSMHQVPQLVGEPGGSRSLVTISQKAKD